MEGGRGDSQRLPSSTRPAVALWPGVWGSTELTRDGAQAYEVCVRFCTCHLVEVWPLGCCDLRWEEWWFIKGHMSPRLAQNMGLPGW